MLPKYYGDIETNLGAGSIFYLIQNYNGDISKSLKYYLYSNEELEKHRYSISIAMLSLKKYLLEQHVITRNLLPENIVCQKVNQNDFRLFVIDNIGNSDFIPICTYSKFFARMKIKRKWRRFKEKIFKIDVNNNLYIG